MVVNRFRSPGQGKTWGFDSSTLCVGDRQCHIPQTSSTPLRSVWMRGAKHAERIGHDFHGRSRRPRNSRNGSRTGPPRLQLV